MWIDQNGLETIAIVIVAFAFGIVVTRIDRRARAIKNQLGRLSLTFLKIENDLLAIHESLLMMSDHNEKTFGAVGKAWARRNQRFERMVVEPRTVPQVMRGLEEPDIDDDPAFWAEDRMKRFGLEDDEVSQGKENILP